MTRPGPPNGNRPPSEPEWWRRSAALRRVPLVAAVVIGFIILRAFSGSSPPALRTSCTTPAFALSTYSTTAHHAIQWSATGPRQDRFALTVGAAGLRSDGGRLTPVPESGLRAAQVLVAGPESFGGGCTAHGSFGVTLPVRSYSVRMFLVPATGQPRQVATKTLKVTAY